MDVVALGFVKVNFKPVYKGFHLKTFKLTESKPGSRYAERTQGRKKIERDILQQLSCYFKRDSGNWSRQALLLVGMMDGFSALATFPLTRFLTVTEEMLELEAHWIKLQKLPERQELKKPKRPEAQSVGFEGSGLRVPIRYLYI